jgi:phenylacetate-CoA ligase
MNRKFKETIMTFLPLFKGEEELKACQLEGLQWTVNHAGSGSEFYRDHLNKAGVVPEDIRTLDDLEKLPFTTAKDLANGYPFPLLSVPFEKVARIHASSGTTGNKKVLCYTQKDIDDWVHFFARCYEMAGFNSEDRIQIAVGYGLWTAGFGFQLGCEKFGAMAIPVGPGNIDLQCQFLMDLQTTAMMVTSSMALLMAEEIHRRGILDKINLKKITIGSERCSAAMRERIQELLGLEDIFEITGMTELYGPGMGMECAHHTGIHYWADGYILEIIDPDTLKPVPEGEIGEMVVTTLKKEAVPLIRYRTRDLTRMIPGRCPCGSILPRHDQILGRSDDMIIYRAVNIYPGQIDAVLSAAEGVSSEYQIVLDRQDDGKDLMTIRVERALGVEGHMDNELSRKIKSQVKKQIMVSPEVEITDYGSLPRSERKTKRVFDNRPDGL